MRLGGVGDEAVVADVVAFFTDEEVIGEPEGAGGHGHAASGLVVHTWFLMSK